LDTLKIDLKRELAAVTDLHLALVKIISAFQADSGTIHLLGADGVLHLTAHHGIPEQVVNIVKIVPVGKGMAGLAVQRMSPVNICNIQTDNSGDVRPGAKATAMQGAIVVPMMSAGKAVGALGIANSGERTFTDAETATLAEFAAIIVEHVR
jgi:L-methionine (R)-S-oxide reductase